LREKKAILFDERRLAWKNYEKRRTRKSEKQQVKGEGEGGERGRGLSLQYDSSHFFGL
jgi:hypothetical protein